ncbi:MAG: hypothetical protein ACPGTP_03690 [Bacteroidia bacterium]
MSEELKTPGTDVVPPHWIAPGISFPNPSLVKTATHARRTPWMMAAGWEPLSVMEEGYPDTHSAGLPGDKKLGIRKPYWRRRFKNNRIRRMGHNHREVPTFDEVGLGQSANMTNQPAPTSERGIWGNLTSLLSAAGSIWQKTEALKIQQKAAVEQARIQAQSEANSILPDASTLAVIAGAGIVGIWLYQGGK